MRSDWASRSSTPTASRSDTLLPERVQEVDPEARPELFEGDAFAQPQPERDVVEQARGAVGRLVLAATCDAQLDDGLDVALDARRVLPAPTAERGGGACADAQPLAVAPVRQVMSTRSARPSPVRDLVLLVPRLRQARACQFVLIRDHVVVGQDQPPGRHVAPHRHVRLERQQVARQVLGRQPHRRVERPCPVLQRLAGQPVHEVQVDREPGLVRPGQRLARLVRRMPAPEPLKHRVVQALRADAQPRHARRPKATQLGQVGVAWVRLERDLDARHQPKAVADRLQHPPHLRRLPSGSACRRRRRRCAPPSPARHGCRARAAARRGRRRHGRTRAPAGRSRSTDRSTGRTESGRRSRWTLR